MPPHKIKRSVGRPPKRKWGGEQPGSGRPTKLNDTLAEKIYERLADGTPFRYACLINGIGYETGLSWCKTNPTFSRRVEEFRTIGIEKYREIATKQGAGWKILKSLDKGREYSDEVKIKVDEDPVEVIDDSGNKSII